jgi:hypothetical protein
MDPIDLTGWTPARIRFGAVPEVEWVYTGDRRFGEPFFEQTLGQAVRDPFALFFRRRTGLDTLAALARERPGLRPAGLVFHLSRCGSTLVTQMLSRSPRFRVLSEPSPVDAVLRAPVPRADRITLLRDLVSVLGRPLAGETTFVLKLDSWSVVDLDLVEEAFPETPWIFLFRQPEEVLASQLRHSGVHGVAGALPPQLFGLEPCEAAELPREEYLARVLARICDAALEHAGTSRGLFVDYERLPSFVLDGLPQHFGFELTPPEPELMAAAASRDAKNPLLPFEPSKFELDPAARALSGRLLEPLYERLSAC